MLFNSAEFVGFLIVVYGLYRALGRSFKAQNALLLAASYFFYGCWDWRFLGLIAFTTLVDYSVGLKLAGTDNPAARKRWLAVSVVTDLSVLGFFKYFNFFSESFNGLLRLAGLHADPLTLKIILPVGISFYTFQSLSYTIDVYKKRMEAIRFLPDYALFVSMFPQLLSGPIARARTMLPQIQSPRAMGAEQTNAALFLILWGYFKKTVIADNLALTANLIFDHYTAYHGLDLLIGALAFAVQIYCDFSGYADIARGVARLFGFELMLNFRLPYFALSPADFWTRWNISLSTWLTDYIFWPLMSTRPWKLSSKRRLEFHTYRNMLFTMLLGGLWHGASWNFVLWGGYYGTLLIVHRLIEPDPPPKNPWKQDRAMLKIAPRMALMFTLTLIGWVLFRSRSVDQIVHFFTAVGPIRSAETATLALNLVMFSLPLLLMQLWQYRSANLLVPTTLRFAPRMALYIALVLGISVFGVREASEFIYFQF